MESEIWTAVDGYLDGLIAADDAVLRAALDASTDAGLPAIQVTATQGKFLHLLARLCSARRILEIGTLGGYSTIWLARALPQDGTLITIESEQKHADVARANIARAGLDRLVDIRVGAAADVLAGLDARETFDLVFIDADKSNTPRYFERSLQLTRPGSLIVVDNVIRKGTIMDAYSEDADVQGMRSFLALAAATPGVSATVLQTVGSKGYDGFALLLVTQPQ
jgi:predicted O-methyltransferase YrrM